MNTSGAVHRLCLFDSNRFWHLPNLEGAQKGGGRGHALNKNLSPEAVHAMAARESGQTSQPRCKPFLVQMLT